MMDSKQVSKYCFKEIQELVRKPPIDPDIVPVKFCVKSIRKTTFLFQNTSRTKERRGINESKLLRIKLQKEWCSYILSEWDTRSRMKTIQVSGIHAKMENSKLTERNPL